MIIAKPVVDKKFWILHEDNEKIGNVEACDGGYQVRINDEITQYKSIKMVEKNFKIVFEHTPKKTVVKKPDHELYGVQTKYKVHNPTWNVQFKLPIYTSDKKSKSWLAAGWFKIKKGRHWSVIQDPKLILLERYPYQGPYNTEEEIKNG
jgi:hypothetical protein